MTTSRKRVLSGMQPSGLMHLGNHLGALENWKALQGEYDCYFFVADWHALSTNYADTSRVREFVREEAPAVILYLDLDVPVGAEAWFESAIECAAFLAFELSQRNTRIRFITQTWDATNADIYTILKYLALVSPQAGRPETVLNHNDLHIVFTQYPERFRALGGCPPQSRRAWLVGPDYF